jgi:hypothetical protein
LNLGKRAHMALRAAVASESIAQDMPLVSCNIIPK